MEATVVLVLFLAVICGGMTLMLAAGYQSAEKERARRASREHAEPVVGTDSLTGVPSFFVAPDTSIPPVSIVFDDALVRLLEQHVRMEQTVAARFVHNPSVDSLYQQAGSSLHVH